MKITATIWTDDPGYTGSYGAWVVLDVLPFRPGVTRAEAERLVAEWYPDHVASGMVEFSESARAAAA
jgi:hypothetical protein